MVAPARSARSAAPEPTWLGEVLNRTACLLVAATLALLLTAAYRRAAPSPSPSPARTVELQLLGQLPTLPGATEFVDPATGLLRRNTTVRCAAAGGPDPYSCVVVSPAGRGLFSAVGAGGERLHFRRLRP